MTVFNLKFEEMKNYRNLIAQLVIIGGLVIMTGCATSTNITASWDNPDIKNETYSNVLVTAMVDDISARQNLEDELVEELKKSGIDATKSLDIFPPKLKEEEMRSKDELLNAIEENRFDGVLTIAVIDQENDVQYVPGNYPYTPMNTYSYYGTFWGYYNYWYPQMYNTGYYDIDKTYFLETNLYDAESEKLVWSAQSKTVNPVSLETFTENFSEKIIDSIEKENLLGTDKNMN